MIYVRLSDCVCGAQLVVDAAEQIFKFANSLHSSIYLQRRAGNEDWLDGGKNSGKTFISTLLFLY